MIITITEESIPEGKLNSAELVAELATALGVDAEDIGINATTTDDGTVIESIEIEVPDGSDSGDAVAAVEAHNPAQSDQEEEAAEPSLQDQIDDLEARVTALEGA